MPQQKQLKILLIGDSCTDEYVYGTCDRLNPEAPVPILNFKRKDTTKGCLLYTSPSPRDKRQSRMPSSA